MAGITTDIADSNTSFDEGKAYSALMGILSEVPPAKRLSLLKAVSGAHGHRLLPGLGLVTNQHVPTVGQRPPKVQRQPPNLKSAKQKEIEVEISNLNKAISKESTSIGARLPDNHPLMERRYQFFRALRAEKAGDCRPQSGQGSQNL
jgi:hypothetical protein